MNKRTAFIAEKVCGNPNCSVSLLIDEVTLLIDEVTLTFGTGKLSDIGDWENPCKLCEDAYNEATNKGKTYEHSKCIL